MKTRFKWLGALALMIMGAFMFTSCGDDDDVWAPGTLEQLIGTWTVQSSKNGPEAGSQLTFNADGTITMEDGSTGHYEYDEETGAFWFQVGDFEVEGVIKMSGSTATVTFETNEGEGGNIVLKKGTSGGGGGGTGSYPERSDLYGTWQMTSATESGSPVGDLFTLSSNGTITMESSLYGNANGTWTYSKSNGQISINFPGMFDITGTVTINKGVLTIAYTDGKGNSQNVVMSPYSGGGGEGGDEVDWSTIPAFVATYSQAPSMIPTGTEVKFNDDGTCLLAGTCYFYTRTYDNEDGYPYWEYKFYEYSSSGSSSATPVARGKFNFVQNGNVFNGKIKINQGGSETNNIGVTFTKSGYTVPSSGIKGRWQITDTNIDGPEIGMVMVFGESGELYIEGQPDIDFYAWDSSSNQLYLDLIDETGSFTTTGGWSAGAVGTFSLGSYYVKLQKL